MKTSGHLHRRTKDYGKSPAAILHDTTLSDGAARLYAHMHWRYGNNHRNFETVSSMGKLLGVDRKVIQQRIIELEARDWVVVIERKSEKKGEFTSNVYHVFEIQEDARQFRKECEAKNVEGLRPRPAMTVKPTRKGKGGKPSHRNGASTGTQVPTVITGTQVPTDEGTQVPTIQSQYYPVAEETDAATALVNAWIQSAKQYLPLGYNAAKCIEMAKDLLTWNPPITPEDVRIVTTSKVSIPRKSDYAFAYLVADLTGYQQRRVAQKQAPKAATELDGMSQWRAAQMKKEAS
jgi:hypothetical protein